MAFPQMEKQIHTVIYAKQEVNLYIRSPKMTVIINSLELWFVGLGEHGMCNLNSEIQHVNSHSVAVHLICAI